MADEVTNFVAGKVAESLFDVAKKEVGYMWNSREHVEKFRSEYVKLKNKRRRVEHRMTLATEKGDVLQDGVQEWVNEADAHITTAEAFLQEEAGAKKTFLNLPMCVNLRTLRRYGKEATNKVLSLEQHLKDGAAYEGDVSIPASVGTLELLRRQNINDLETHKSVLEKIIRSVNRTQITGIWGIGGVGKTTLATEVAARVKHLFDLVVFVTVSRPIDAEKIKKDVDIAVKRIIKGDKVLIILDDVWDALKLDTVGIPSCVDDHPNFKILLTSRERSVCKAMDAQEIGVDSLPIDEAWILFKRVVSEEVETDANLRQVAREIVKGCGGLPLILQAVGKALKDKKSIKEWEHARESIQKHKTSDIDEDIELEFAHLQLSYDYVKSEEAKSIFLLCCMFPEDFDIPLELLAYYGVGLELFEEPYSLEDARNKVQRAVKILKSSCLLLVGKDESTTKMHDVVRQVALLIASKGTSKGKNKFLVEAGKNLTLWEPRPGSLSYTGISLMRNKIHTLPAGYKLNIPLLKIFLVQGNYNLSEISDEFILAMQAVKVIDFGYDDISSLPKSLNQLTRLRMLNLRGNESFDDVSILGELEDLEILILSQTGIKKIPQEIGKLVKLRLFHAAGCPDLSHIEPGVLSKLRWLEELSIWYHPVEGKDNSLVETGNFLNTGFLIDPVESPSHGSTSLTDGSTEFFAQNRLSVTRPVHGSTSRFNPSVKTLEIGELRKLTSLQLWVPHICLIPEGDYHKRLKTFCIQIGGSQEFFDDDIRAGDKSLILETLDDDISHLKHVRKWIEVCNKIVIRSINNLDKLMPMMYCEGFGFKSIEIGECANLVYLVDSLDEMQTSFFSSIGNHKGVKENILSEVERLFLFDLSSLKVIWNCADEYISLKNLVTLFISFCPKLEKLFSVSVAQRLVNLKELRIQWCDSLKEVISDGDGETSTSEIDLVVPPKNIVFRRLAKIELDGMESLTSFYPGNATIEYPSLVTVEIISCDKLEKWGYGTHHTPKLQFVEINFRKVNGSTIDETLVKYREAVELEKKQRLVST